MTLMTHLAIACAYGSRSLPCSAMAGQAKTSAIKAMQTLRTLANESWKSIAWSADKGFDIRIQAEDSARWPGDERLDRTRKSGKICWIKGIHRV